jgi:hypothetical protein
MIRENALFGVGFVEEEREGNDEANDDNHGHVNVCPKGRHRGIKFN